MNKYSEGLSAAARGEEYRREDLIVLPVTETTMKIIGPMIEDGTARDGTSAIALRQTNGVGSVDIKTGKPRQWFSPQGNLLMSRAVTSPGHAGEIEFTAALAVAEIIADFLPRACVEMKFPNDILVNGAKIGGCLVPPEYELNAPKGSGKLINLGIGVNLAVAPRSHAIREGATVADVACLKDHGVDLNVGEFLDIFDTHFEKLGDLHREKGFTAILQRIGFAGENGELALLPQGGGPEMRGHYNGSSVERLPIEEVKYAACIRLLASNGEELVLPYHAYTTRSRIAGATSIGMPRPVLAREEPHV